MPANELFAALREETLPRLAPALEALERARQTGSPEHLKTVRELIHKITGTAGVVGLMGLSQLCRLGEGVAVLGLDGEAKVGKPLCDLLESVLRAIEAALEHPPDAKPAAPELPAPAPSPSVARTGPGRVVVASDEAVSAKVLVRSLEEAAFAVRRTSLDDAIERLPDCEVVVVDVPSNDRGPERARHALENAHRQHVPVLLVAKGDAAAPVLASLAARAHGLLTKPVRPDELDAKVKELIARRLAVAAARAKAPTGQAPAQQPKVPLKVLIVDDSRVIRGIVREALNEVGVTTFEASDGAEALKAFDQHQPDAVISDLQMPGVDGTTLMRQLRAQNPQRRVPILVLSALEDDASRQAGLSAGADAYLVKSIIDGPALLRALKTAGLPLP
ncbi:MAG: response regulator [Archangiaceae bacterium]|nr:response regulator [Archangiaceae bacterium]